MKTAAESLDRLEALARKLAERHSQSIKDGAPVVVTDLGAEAVALVAEMVPPVDPLLIKARSIVARHCVTTDGPVSTLRGDYDDGPFVQAVLEALRSAQA